MVDRDVLSVLSLYRRCKRYRALPKSGGLFEQEEAIFALFDVIENESERCRLKKMEEKQDELEKQKMLKELHAR